MENIKEIRNLTRLSQAAFSKKFGIPLRTYQSWEGEERKPAKYVITMIKQIIDLEKEIETLRED